MNSELKSEALLLAALNCLAESEMPVGARRLSEVFRAQGANLAEATTGRFLRRLEEDGYAEQVGVRGRILTQLGLRRRNELSQRAVLNDRAAQVTEAIDPETVAGLLDLLYARRAVESEAARLAAEKATDGEIAAIVEAGHSYVDCMNQGVDNRLELAHELHRLVGEASHNKVLAALIALLVDQSNDRFARLLDEFVVSAGTIDSSGHDHSSIGQALARRDPQATEEAMRRHLDGLIAVVETYRSRFPQATNR